MAQSIGKNSFRPSLNGIGNSSTAFGTTSQGKHLKASAFERKGSTADMNYLDNMTVEETPEYNSSLKIKMRPKTTEGRVRKNIE